MMSIPHALLVPHVARTVEACRGRRIVAAQDTTEINFDRSRQPVAGLGPTGNTDIRGFFIHPVVAVDADDEALLGVLGARIWTREEEPTPDHRCIPFEEKESRRWLDAAETAATQLGIGCQPSRRCGRSRRRHLSIVLTPAREHRSRGSREP